MSRDATAIPTASHTGGVPAGRGHIEWTVHRALRTRAAAWAVGAGAFLLSVYFVILTVANSSEHALQELGRLWYWMVPLVLGFSVQIGLFAYARRATREGGAMHARSVVASGGASTLSMVACCAHHVTDLLPVVGLAGAATVLAMYQGLFLLLGVLSNLIGLVYVLGMLRRHGLYPSGRSWLTTTLALPFDRMLLPVMGVSALVFFSILLGAVA